MIAVIGAGAFGTALASALASDGTPVFLWSRREAQVDAINTTRINHDRLPGIALPASLTATGDLQRVSDAKAVLLVLPAQQTAGFLEQHIHDLPDVPLVLCAKGITSKGLRLQSELVPGTSTTVVLTGPGFAGEIARGLPTALTIASDGPEIRPLQEMLSRPGLRLYRSNDPVGAQLGGALKNVVAIAAGIAIGAGLGESARAAIMTRGFSEMRRLAMAMGADDNTLSGLSGLGDLALTCASEKSRNFAHGLALGRNEAAAIQTVEGVATARASVELAAKHRIEMPIAAAVAQVLEQKITIETAMAGLLARPLRAE